MIDLRPGLRAFLLADATIAGLVVARIYPLKIPQGIKLTSIVYSEISSRGDHHMQGASGLASPRIQLSAWSPSADGAHALALAIKSRLDGYKGTMGTGPTLVTVQGAFFDSWRDVFDGEAALYGKHSDYRIHYEEL